MIPLALSSSPSSSALPMDLRLDAARYLPSFRCIMQIRARNPSTSNRRARGDLDILCRASKGRGFGPEPPKKEKSNDTKTPKDSVSSKPRSFSEGRYTRSGQAPELIKDINKKSSNVVLDREFLEKVESVRRSTLEQKKVEENKINQTIDYDAPIESEQSTIGLGTKVGVGIAVVVFGLVFALGDFLPSGSVNPSDEASIVVKKLTEEEKETYQSALQQYEQILSKSPEDPGALEGASVTLVELGEYDRASAFLEKLIKEKPNYVDAYRLLGEVKYALKDFEGSVSSYRSSLAVSDSIDFEVLRGLTNSLIAAKKPNEAVQVLLASRESLNDKNVKRPDISGDANANLDEKTQKVDPIQVDLLLGKAYSDWGHVSDAIAVYDQIISEYPNDFRGYLAKGIILKENGKVGDAERMFIQARFFAPEKAKALVDRYARR